MAKEFRNEITARLVSFLRDIGIAVVVGDVDDSTFLPGISVVGGRLVVDESKLLYPGDLLHEAGHLAVAPSSERTTLFGMVKLENAKPHVIEAEAMSWSYAAAVYLGLDPRIVFHSNGYHGGSESLLTAFGLGVFPGLHELESAGMTLSPVEAAKRGAAPFPVMQKWLRD